MPTNHNHGKVDPLTAFMSERFATEKQPHPVDVREDERQAGLIERAERVRQWRAYANDVPHYPAEASLSGSSLRILREACGLTTAELGQVTGTDARTVESYEADRDVHDFTPTFLNVAGAMRDALLEAS
jgi:DNA-binding transcriptional regulator YiaG